MKQKERKKQMRPMKKLPGKVAPNPESNRLLVPVRLKTAPHPKPVLLDAIAQSTIRDYHTLFTLPNKYNSFNAPTREIE